MIQKTDTSPRWSSTTKLLVGLVIVSLVAFLIYRFSNLVPPLLMIFIFTYLLHPVTASLSRGLRLPWKLSVNIIYLLIVIILAGLLTWGGVGLVGQAQSFVRSIQGIITDLPSYISELSTQVFVIGPFELDMKTFDLKDLSSRLLSFIEPLLGQTGNLVGALAGGAASTLGWTIFILTVSYFVMVESSGLREDLLKIDIPGYTEDLQKLGSELSRIWNAFLRGQIIVFLLALAIYSILLPALGVRYAIGIAFLAGLAKFLPYIGPAITWVIMALVTFFQPAKPFGLQDNALTYMLIVVITTSVIDWFMDNFITPRIMARTLRVHPAAVLVAAIIAASLLGLLGVIIAAPFLATFLLLGRYIMRKMFDLDPWPEREEVPPPPSIRDLVKNLAQFWRSRFVKNREDAKPKKEKKNERQP
ncbi:MAG TPA: AI-2E family transporter [Anaerolineales bacterium]|nr:AI-2E family transporter [Anaerolineales bacterium]